MAFLFDDRICFEKYSSHKKSEPLVQYHCSNADVISHSTLIAATAKAQINFIYRSDFDLKTEFRVRRRRNRNSVLREAKDIPTAPPRISAASVYDRVQAKTDEYVTRA